MTIAPFGVVIVARYMVLVSISIAGGEPMRGILAQRIGTISPSAARPAWVRSRRVPSLGVPRPPSHAEVSAILARQDDTMAALVARHGPMRIGPRPRVANRFEALARHVAYQQLAGAAASTIWGRTRALVDGAFTPEQV